MSDDDQQENWKANQGVTLPKGQNATHNIGLSPFFVIREGDAQGPYEDLPVLSNRGVGGYLRASASQNEFDSYFYATGDTRSYPSFTYTGNLAYPLRCLVSTN